MISDNLTIGLIGLSAGDLNGLASDLDNRGLVLQTHATLESWLASSGAANGQAGGVGSGSTGHTSEDCLVVVGSLPDATRRRVANSVEQSRPGVPLVCVSEAPSTGQTAEAMRQGAFDVVDFASDAEAIFNSVRQAAVEGRRTAPARRQRLLLERRLASLTPAERQVLDALLDGMANKQIAQHLQIGLRTVELRRSKIMKKMKSRSLAELVKFVCQVNPDAMQASENGNVAALYAATAS